MSFHKFIRNPLSNADTIARVSVCLNVLRDGWLTYLLDHDDRIIRTENGIEQIYEFQHRNEAIAAGRWFAEKYKVKLYLMNDPIVIVEKIASECGGNIFADHVIFDKASWKLFCQRLDKPTLK